MRTVSRPAGITFEGELPLPEINLLLYRRIYVIEQWLRRIALAALTARYGPRWNDAVPSDIRRTLKARLMSLHNRVAFDTEDSDNAVWILTLDELKTVLTYEKVWPFVKELTALDRQQLHARLNELREIRNVVGHNRAATDYTAKVFDAIEHALGEGIEHFRDRFLYDFAGAQQSGESTPDSVTDAFYGTRSPLGRQQIGLDTYFYYVYVLAAENGRPIHLGDLLEHFGSVQKVILAILINRRSLGEHTVVWPRSASATEHSDVLARFDAWQTLEGEPYVAQNPRYVCHPKVWFVY